jgi:hypothetical protein
MPTKKCGDSSASSLCQNSDRVKSPSRIGMTPGPRENGSFRRGVTHSEPCIPGPRVTVGNVLRVGFVRDPMATSSRSCSVHHPADVPRKSATNRPQPLGAKSAKKRTGLNASADFLSIHTEAPGRQLARHSAPHAWPVRLGGGRPAVDAPRPADQTKITNALRQPQEL